MSTADETSSSTPGGTLPEIPTEKDALERDIEQTRAQLADTVEALAHKADVKAQVKEKSTELKEHAKEAVGHAKERTAELAGQAKDKTAELAGHAKTTAGSVGHSVSHAAPDFSGGPKQAAQRPQNQQIAAVAVAGFLAALVWFLRRRRS